MTDRSLLGSIISSVTTKERVYAERCVTSSIKGGGGDRDTIASSFVEPYKCAVCLLSRISEAFMHWNRSIAMYSSPWVAIHVQVF